MTTSPKIEIKNGGGERPWHVYIDGKILRNKAGLGRRFKNKDAALHAGIKARDEQGSQP